jgi:uncharacterized membrane protein
VILLAALLVAVGTVLVLVGTVAGGLGWLYGAIVAVFIALVVLALGVAREVRGSRPASGIETSRRDTPGVERDPENDDPDPPPH